MQDVIFHANFKRCWGALVILPESYMSSADSRFVDLHETQIIDLDAHFWALDLIPRVATTGRASVSSFARRARLKSQQTMSNSFTSCLPSVILACQQTMLVTS